MTPDRPRRRSSQPPGSLTPALVALREAARALAEGDAAAVTVGDAPPAEATAPPENQSAPPSEEAPSVLGVSPPAALLAYDEIYVGRPGLGEKFAYRDADGNLLATVKVVDLDETSKVEAVLAGESADHLDERWVVLEEEPIFHIERYHAAEEPSYGVFDPAGRHLATYLCDGGLLHRKVVVREAASAPAATIRVHDHRHVIRELDGRELGWCWRAFSAIGNDNDDEVWGLRVERPPALLDRRALVAAPLVCHLMAVPKRQFDSGSEIAIALVIAVPPVGLAVAAAERAVDGLTWLRRRLE